MLCVREIMLSSIVSNICDLVVYFESSSVLYDAYLNFVSRYLHADKVVINVILGSIIHKITSNSSAAVKLICFM